jgi:arginine decarboxylase
VDVKVAAAVGSGPTGLAAFDASLRAAGVANRNLIRLSSVIPPDVKVQSVDEIQAGGQWGDRLYCVYAEQRAVERGHEAWAGVAWAQDDTGKGLFVEHEGASRHAVEADLVNTLDAMCAARGFIPTVRDSVVVGGTCEDAPIAALVIAAFKVESW